MESRKRSCTNNDDDQGRKMLRMNETFENANLSNDGNGEKEILDIDEAVAALQLFMRSNPVLSNLSQAQQTEVFNKAISKSNNLSTSQNLKDYIPLNIFEQLESHQKEGIEFLFQRVIGNVRNSHEDGNGAILAHNMGLGKTLTIIAFLYAVLSCEKLKENNIFRILLVVPKNVINQWKSEIKIWINKNKKVRDNSGKIHIIESVPGKNKTEKNCKKINKWYTTNNEKRILLVTYEQLKMHLQEKAYNKYLCSPDIAVFDEAHRLKNDETKTYEMAASVQTQRKIFVTGTPHQNNLKEFYNLIQHIAPGVLSSKENFDKFFIEPIQNGQHRDAQPIEIKTMRIRCYVLYEMLVNVIHRKSLKTLKEILTVKQDEGIVKQIQKYEITIKVRSSPFQKKLLDKYLARTDPYTGLTVKEPMMSDHTVVWRLLAHPTLIYRYAEESANTYDKRLTQKRNKYLGKEVFVKTFTTDWMGEDSKQKKEDELDYTLSYKFMVLIEIIKQCEEKGDKLLIFSQFVYILDIMEQILKKYEDIWFSSHKAKKANNQSWGWKKGVDYFRIDGKVSADDRYDYQKQFNKTENPQCRLMLISTKAGGLGTNLIGANRVVLFDACWNPSHDIQSLYRTYRIQQQKDVFVYRLVTYGTMSDAIYKRQINKELTGHRVLDNGDLENPFYKNELIIRTNYHVPEYVEPEINLNFNDEIINELVKKIPQTIVSVESHDTLFDITENDELKDETFLRERLGFQKWYIDKVKLQL